VQVSEERRLVSSLPTLSNSASRHLYATFHVCFASGVYSGEGAVVAGGLGGSGGGVESHRGSGIMGGVVIGAPQWRWQPGRDGGSDDGGASSWKLQQLRWRLESGRRL
jgi:hypothetical protein